MIHSSLQHFYVSHVRRVARICALLIASAVLVETAGAQTFEIVDLEVDALQSEAWSINNRGEIVGVAFSPGRNAAFLWQSGTVIKLGPLGATSEACPRDSSWAFDINERGQIVGRTEFPVPGGGCGSKAFVWENGGVTYPVLPGGRSSDAWSINNRGQVVGGSEALGTGGMAFLFDTRKDSIIALGLLEPGPRAYSAARGINQRGQVVGLGTLGGLEQAFVWDRKSGFRTFGADQQLTHPSAINDRGQVVGRFIPLGGTESRAFIWKNGQMIDLGTLGGNYAWAHDINNLGQVVGESRNEDGFRRAFLWDNGKMIDLGSLGGTRSRAHGINDGGDIVGMAETAAGEFRAVLWKRVE